MEHSRPQRPYPVPTTERRIADMTKLITKIYTIILAAKNLVDPDKLIEWGWRLILSDPDNRGSDDLVGRILVLTGQWMKGVDYDLSTIPEPLQNRL